ncbi:hypothetical protein ACFPLB_16555 [Aquamicrobium segne]|uniref:Uncharacterized protein n=1 Tax=Aquamicrobium segne TaxID=469547 RepID=A0ABW0H334_9HYPH
MTDNPKFKMPPFNVGINFPKIDTSIHNNLNDAFRKFSNVTSKIDWNETEEIIKRMHAARNNPDDPKSKIWEAAIGGVTPRAASLFWRHLPDPLKRRGRPAGSGELAADDAFFREMKRRITASNKPVKTVAREMIEERGGVEYAEKESRVNYLARLYRQREKK